MSVPSNLFHNQWINHYNHKDDDEAKRPRDITPVNIPSKQYVFDHIKESVSCRVEHEGQRQENVDCNIIITAPHDFATSSILSTVRIIGQYQTMINLDVTNINDRSTTEHQVFNMSNSAQSVKLFYCSLPPETLTHLIQQISDCNTIRKIQFHSMDLRPISSLVLANKTQLLCLHLKEAKMTQELIKHVCQQVGQLNHLEYLNMSKIHIAQIDLNLKNNAKLKEVDLSHTHMSRKQSIDLFGQINELNFIHKIKLSENNLAGCLSNFLPDPHPGLPELTDLDLASTAFNREDLLHLSKVTKNNKLPKLEFLDLSKNTLTGCLLTFLADPHPGLSELCYLYLNTTALNKGDLHHLSTITQNNKLPKLYWLQLSYNKMTGCLSSFLSVTHPGLPKLKKLDLISTDLNKEDLQHLADLMKAGKFPQLKVLDLDRALLGKRNELGPLTKLLGNCVKYHNTGLMISLKENNLSVQFQKKLADICAGTNVFPVLLESESTEKIRSKLEKIKNKVSCDQFYLNFILSQKRGQN